MARKRSWHADIWQFTFKCLFQERPNPRINEKNSLWQRAHSVFFFLLGDPAYIWLSYLINNYANVGCNAHEQYFGLSLCRSQMVIEYAFGKLRALFGGLRWAMDINMVDLPSVIYACFVLHNYCESRKKRIDDSSRWDWLTTITQPTCIFRRLNHSYLSTTLWCCKTLLLYPLSSISLTYLI